MLVARRVWGCASDTAAAAAKRAATAANVPRSTAALTRDEVKSATARGYSGVLLGFDILMLKNAATKAISWLDS